MTLAPVRTGAILLLATLLQSCGGGAVSAIDQPPSSDGTLALKEEIAEPVALLSFGPSSDTLQAIQILTAAARLLHQEVLVPQELNCTSAGHVRMSINDNDLNGGLSASDRVVVAYTDCNQSIRGDLELTITRISFDNSEIVSLEGDATINFDLLDLADGKLRGGGGLAYSATPSQVRWIANEFRATYSDTDQVEEMTHGHIERTYDSNNQYTLALSGSVDSDFLNGTYKFRTTTAFAGTEGDWPDSGRLVASGHRGSKIGYGPAPEPETLLYEIDADGNGGFEVTNLGTAWVNVAPPYLFGIDDGPIGPELPPDPPTADVLGRRISLGAQGGDLLADNARGKIYVTVPERNELVILSAQTLEVEQRVTVGPRPKNISFTLDHEELLIALSASGEVQILNLDTFASTRIFVAQVLQTSNVNNVVETSPGILFAASGGTNFGSIARIDRGTGEVTEVPFFGGIFQDVELVADPGHGFLYAGSGSRNGEDLYKFDATDPLVPKIGEDQHGTLIGTENMSLSPDTTRLYLTSGQVVDTNTLQQIGTISFGTSWATDNSEDVVVGRDAGTLIIHSAQSLAEIDTLTTDCALDSESHNPPDVDRISPSPVDGQWLLMGGTILCIIDLNSPRQRPGSGQPGLPETPVPTDNVPVIDLSLGDEAFDAEFDVSRNRIYVSLPATGEIVTVDAATRQVTDRTVFGNAPRGIDLSPDESNLAVMFNGNGHIGFVDVDSGQIDERDLTPDLFAPKGHDVAYVSDNAIFASADEPSGQAYLVKTSRLNPAATFRVTGGDFIRGGPELAASPDGSALFVTENDADLNKFDITQHDAPLVLENGFVDDFFGADRFSVSPDGALMALRGGKVVRTSDFTEAGRVTAGIPLFSHDGSRIFSAGTPGRIDRFSSATFVANQRYQGNCSIGLPRRLLANPEDDVLITMGQSRLCFWLLDEPVAKSVKLGPQSAYVCGAGCLLRNYQKKSGSNSLRIRASGRPGLPSG